ncbi:MAG: hypothetical protein B7Y39_13255 [Bdellovibrio sp. 28-41-41]|nr:MAG: hypothetical protein B7Y39_13255 [Bdellovibrio sp. 28-41-41]
MKMWVFFLFLVVVCVSCTMKPIRDRDPSSSNEDIFSEGNRYRVYFNRLPIDQRESHIIDIPTYNSLSTACPQYLDTIPEDRFSILIPKLNRPFRFVSSSNAEGNIVIAGNLNDMKEFFCLMTAMGEAEEAANLSKADRTELVLKIARLANADFKAMEVMIGTWSGNKTTLAAAQAIIHHAQFDLFIAKDMMGALFRSNNDRQEKVKILKELMATSQFEQNSLELSKVFFRENTLFVTAEERLVLTDLFLNKAYKIDKATLLNFMLSSTDPNYDYRAAYQRFATGGSIDDQFNVLSKMLNSRARLSNTDELILGLWEKATVLATQDAIAKYVVGDISSSKILKNETHFKIISERLAGGPYSGKYIGAVLREIFGSGKFTAAQRLAIAKLISRQDIVDLEVARLYLPALISLQKEGLASGVEFSESTIRTTKHFVDNEEIIRMFSRFLLSINDTKFKNALVIKLLPQIPFDDAFINEFLRNLSGLGDGARYSLVEKILEGPQLTDKSLESVVGTIRGAFQLSDTDKKILNLVLKHPKLTPELSTQINKRLNPVFEYVQDPGGH